MKRVQVNWKSDLLASRDISDFDRGGYEVLLSWLELWRIGKGMEPGRQREADRGRFDKRLHLQQFFK